ncbi:MgtC/SapB family protein [Singulisphaera acidiphila]|uniref:Putative membrane protein n=1 Tax=Singulisphaera acidiphila (strain ATCC BAA-1392 / DSM 18658 / VKM B-2454 / MOB10) TaxID=886293 RepID=L0DQI8_SINAD|nr:MgtC/SapB family protein [Singulisphaera acidiphila]AGA31203.1 putative membrane protein [Singulisphaera acidiphila DSM 18658]
MPLTLRWEDIALRLALTVIAGALVGINRSEGGHAAGLRTTLLVCLAASVAMIQMNLLLPMAGKTPESFAALDLMRLPLGILTGMGFIGGGAILRRGDMVHGITTAATLWLVTIIGLCLGGGQLGLGITALGLALLILWGFKWLESHLPLVHNARLGVVVGADGPSEGELHAMLLQAGFEIASWGVTTKRCTAGFHRTVRCEIRWRGRPRDLRTPDFVGQMARMSGVKALRWEA